MCCALQDVWQQVKDGQIDPVTLREMLEDIRMKADVPLSVRSLSFLSLETGDMQDFVELHKQQPVRRQVCLLTFDPGVIRASKVRLLCLPFRPSSPASPR